MLELKYFKSQPGAIFTPSMEWFNVLLPIIFIAAGLFEASGIIKIDSSEHRWITFMASYLFANVTHVFVTFFLLFALPEGRQLLRPRSIHFYHWTWVAVVFGFALAVYHLAPRWGFTIPAKFELIVLVLLTFLGIYHNIKQTFGFSLIYNKLISAELNNEDKKGLLQFEKKERSYFSFFTIIAIFPAVAYAVPALNPPKNVWPYLFAATLLFLAPLLWTIFSYPFPEAKMKKWYSLRLLLRPLVYFSPAALAGILAIHGIEYCFLAMQMSKRSRSKIASSLWVFVPLICLISLIPFATIYSPEHSTQLFGRVAELTPSWKMSLATMGFVALYLHYYIDSQIFRFSSEDVRSEFGPLVFPKQN